MPKTEEICVEEQVGKLAQIRPFSLNDKLTGNIVKIEVTPNYSVLSINDRYYYFDLETGEFDGVSH